MNKAMSRVFIITVVLFVALIVNLTWIMVVRAQWFQDRPENKRSIAKEMKIKRGDILGFDGSVIAGTQRRSGYYYRDYPNGTIAPQLVGYDSVRYGRSGIEAQLNDELTGQSERPRRAELGRQAAGPPAQGGQRQAHPRARRSRRSPSRSSQGQRGAIVVLDPKTGALIASASAPTYDPANLEDQWSRLSKDPSAPLLNRPTQGLYVPGSSFKVVTASAGLDTGNGHAGLRSSSTPAPTWSSAARSPTTAARCSAPTTSPTRSPAPSTRPSRKVGNMLGRKRLIAATQQYGFYQTPPLPLPAGEVVASGRYGKKGLLSPDAFMDPLAVAWAACGQEQVLATPLQMALVAGGVANGGRVMKPYYLQEIVGARTAPSCSRRSRSSGCVATKPTTASQLNTMMQNVVNAGTGTAAALQGIQVAGKTGTAEKGDGTQPRLVHRLRAGRRPEGGHRRRHRGHAGDRRRGGGAARRRRDQDGAGAARPALRGRDRAPVVVRMWTKERGSGRERRVPARTGDRRPVPRGAQARRRRHGRRLPVRGPHPGPPRRHQGAAAALPRRPDLRRALPPRGQGRRGAQPAEPRQHLRLGRGRRHVLHRHGVRGGRDAQGPHPPPRPPERQRGGALSRCSCWRRSTSPTAAASCTATSSRRTS